MENCERKLDEIAQNTKDIKNQNDKLSNRNKNGVLDLILKELQKLNSSIGG